MPRVDQLPYRIPSDDLIRTDGWRLLLDDQLTPLGGFYPDWEPSVPVRGYVALEIDVDQVLEACRLGKDARLRMGSFWRSPGSGLRGSGDKQDLSAGDQRKTVELSLEAPGTELAESLELCAHLMLLDVGAAEVQSFAPKVLGSTLWRHEESMMLTGEGTRFPIEALDFEASTWLPPRAAWYLDWDPHAFDQAVLGGLRLYVNTGSARLRTAVAGGPDAEPAIREGIYFDVARTLITDALNDEEFVEAADGYGDGTVGAALRRLIHSLFPYDSLDSLAAEQRHHPHRFSSRIQDALALYYSKG